MIRKVVVMKTLALVLKFLPMLVELCKKFNESLSDGKITEDECKDIVSAFVALGYDVVKVLEEKKNADKTE